MAPRRIVKIFSGDTFGRLTVIEPVKNEKDPTHQYFLCKCECGNLKVANSTSLLRGDLQSCGCLWKEKNKEYTNKVSNKSSLPVGYVSGKLTIIEDLGIQQIASKKEHCYKCKCSCGNEVIIRQYCLKHGQDSCGCTQRDNGKKAHIENSRSRRKYPDWIKSLLVYENEKQGIDEKIYPYETKLHFYCSSCGRIIEKPISHIIRLNKDREIPIALCLNCSDHRSSFEEEVYQFISSIIPKEDIQQNVWGVLKQGIIRYELDLYIPKLKFAIECNGDYFHSEQNGKKYNYHLNKFKLAESQGIHLVSLFESYWKENKEKIKACISDMLLSTKRIFARKCSLLLPNKEQIKEFYNANHLQGYTTLCNITYALFYENEIIAMMSFSKTGIHDPKEMSESYYELVRYAVKRSHSIIGGASKLLNQFIKDYNPSKILSYSDNDFFLGNMYKQLGFSFIDYTRPRYHWFLRNQTVRTREQCQLKHLSKEYPDLYQQALSDDLVKNKETFIMESLQAVKVWHSGNKRWVKYCID